MPFAAMDSSAVDSAREAALRKRRERDRDRRARESSESQSTEEREARLHQLRVKRAKLELTNDAAFKFWSCFSPIDVTLGFFGLEFVRHGVFGLKFVRHGFVRHFLHNITGANNCLLLAMTLINRTPTTV